MGNIFNEVDFGALLINTFLVWLFCRLIVKYLDLKNEYPQRHRILNRLWIGAFVFMIVFYYLGADLSESEYLLILFLVIGILLYDLIQIDYVKNVFVLFAPTVLLELLKIITGWLSKSAANVIDGFSNFSILWLIIFGIYLFRKKKTDTALKLKQAEEKRLSDEKRNLLEHLVTERTAEINSQKEVLQKSMDELKATQTQLIQSEKMASLGELTAGIAHEIQNPLNFVNNFSEVNHDLLNELNEERKKPIHERDEQLISDILSDVISNSQKINTHGHRAANIVKSMLDHSRTNTGIKEEVDINELCDEYIRISYHGLRAKDKMFQADFKVELDPHLPIIHAVKQDIGRVLLNLINNAFYAVYSKANTLSSGEKQMYMPLVKVTTLSLKDKIEIKVSDNGEGIEPEIKDKIFQPFFTTKPTGQGTGLGLSLTYDIVKKGHGGDIIFADNDGGGTCFTVTLPVKS